MENIENKYFKINECNDGDFEAEYKLGIRYLHGIGVPIDLEKALLYIKRSAYQGFVYAQVSLAFMYFDGIGVEQNRPKAYIRFKVAADEEYHSRAQLMVGMMHEYGEGERQNMDKVLKYYKRAAEQGNIDAQNKLKWYEESFES
jgi:TPR repeat protein